MMSPVLNDPPLAIEREVNFDVENGHFLST